MMLCYLPLKQYQDSCVAPGVSKRARYSVTDVKQHAVCTVLPLLMMALLSTVKVLYDHTDAIGSGTTMTVPCPRPGLH